MKKYLFLVAIIGFGVATLCSCGSGSTSSEEPKGISEKEKEKLVEAKNYKKACELKEFPTAYEIVDKLKEVTSEKKVWYEGHSYLDSAYPNYKAAKEKSDEAERYVVLQESMYVLESEGTNGLMRIIGIGKEHNAEDWLYPELLDVAKKIGDTDLANKIENIIQPNNGNNTEAEEDKDEEVEESTSVQPAPKKSNAKRRRRR
jgi:hypothetical protein